MTWFIDFICSVRMAYKEKGGGIAFKAELSARVLPHFVDECGAAESRYYQSCNLCSARNQVFSEYFMPTNSTTCTYYSGSTPSTIRGTTGKKLSCTRSTASRRCTWVTPHVDWND
jgi:hypothetical protein